MPNVAGHQATCSHGQMVDGWLLYQDLIKRGDAPWIAAATPVPPKLVPLKNLVAAVFRVELRWTPKSIQEWRLFNRLLDEAAARRIRWRCARIRI